MTVAEESGRGVRRAWARDRLRGQDVFDGVFPRAARRAGVLYVLLSVPVVGALSAVVDVPYVVLFAALPVVAYGVPALVLASLAVRRVPRRPSGRGLLRTLDRASYLLWAGGTALIVLVGVGMLVGDATGWHGANAAGPPVVAAIAVLLIAGAVRLTRRRSGQRALSVDMAEAAMSTVALVAPAAVLWGDTALSAAESWFTVPAALATVGFAFGSYWTLALVVRLGPHAGVVEKAGLAFTLVGCANAAAQVAQGASGFTLPTELLVTLHGTCAGMMFLVPLHLRLTAGPGLDRLPPQAQVRAGYLSTLVVLASLPALFLATVVAERRTPAAPWFAFGATALLVVLAGVRHLATIKETRRLYAQVEAASEERHRLLARLLERGDEDRHRVAAQLLEQTITAYMSLLAATTPAGPRPRVGGPGGPLLPEASEHVRDDLAQRADSLRQLMQAIEPAGADPTGTRTLAVPIQAYLDSLYGDAAVPHLAVTAASGFFLDWPTETVALRIIHEALHNVWRHSNARHVWVTIEADAGDAVTVVRIRDDGAGFRPPVTAGHGVATMRGLAALVDGTVDLDAAPGAGTTVTAHLRPTAPADPGQGPDRSPRLRLVPAPPSP